jgi:hypothetical protein
MLPPSVTHGNLLCWTPSTYLLALHQGKQVPQHHTQLQHSGGSLRSHVLRRARKTQRIDLCRSSLLLLVLLLWLLLMLQCL